MKTWVGKQRAWLLLRDGDFYRVYRTRKIAVSARDNYAFASKHKWTIRRVMVTEIH